MKAMNPEDWKCSGCGCTEAAACKGGCHWVAPNYCSACLAKAPPLTDEERKVALWAMRGTKVRMDMHGGQAVHLLEVLQLFVMMAERTGKPMPSAMQAALEKAFKLLIGQLSLNVECARLIQEGWRDPGAAPVPEPERKLIVSAEAAAEINKLPPGKLLVP